MASQLSICILPSELPLDGAPLCVSIALPGSHFGLQALPGFHPAIQALATEDANFDLRHVQPAGVLGRVVELNRRSKMVALLRPSTSSKHFLKWMFKLSRTR